MRLRIRILIALIATLAGYAPAVAAGKPGKPRTVVYVGVQAGEQPSTNLSPALLALQQRLLIRLKTELQRHGGDPADLNGVRFLPGDYVGDQSDTLPLRWKKYNALFLLWGNNEAKKSGYILRHRIFFGDILGSGAKQFEGVNGILRNNNKNEATIDLHLIFLGYAILLDASATGRDKLIQPLANTVKAFLDKVPDRGGHRTSPCRVEVRKGVDRILWIQEHPNKTASPPVWPRELICTTSSS